MKELRFIIVDNNNIYRNVLKKILVNQFDAVILAEASSAEELMSTKPVHAIHETDIILMDVMLPGKSGIELARELLWYYDSHLKIIAITLHADKVNLTTLLETGFKGCILKEELFLQLNMAIKQVMDGKLFFPSMITLDKKEVENR